MAMGVHISSRIAVFSFLLFSPLFLCIIEITLSLSFVVIVVLVTSSTCTCTSICIWHGRVALPLSSLRPGVLNIPPSLAL